MVVRTVPPIPPTPARPLTSLEEAVVWAHEFGHNQGIPGDYVTPPDRVMNVTNSDVNRQVSAAECTAFQQASVPNILALTQVAQKREAGMIDISDFVRQRFIHGVPYEEASKYDSSVVPTLLSMLNDPAEEEHWANIVIVLGIIGDEHAVDPLIAFIEADYHDDLSSEAYRAKTAALMALGYLINKTGNREAIAYLTTSLNPAAWEARDVVGIAPFQADTTERNDDLSKHAILGLALSGHPRAAQVLRSLQQPARLETQSVFRNEVSDLVTDALKEHAKIARRGLASYYRTDRP